jgi:hypothetical protein
VPARKLATLQPSSPPPPGLRSSIIKTKTKSVFYTIIIIITSAATFMYTRSFSAKIILPSTNRNLLFYCPAIYKGLSNNRLKSPQCCFSHMFPPFPVGFVAMFRGIAYGWGRSLWVGGGAYDDAAVFSFFVSGSPASASSSFASL